MLSVKDINLYYGAAQALRSVSLKAEVGRILCVLGRNGVGKSSLLRAIVGQHGIASGSIQWNGKEVRTLAPHQRARLGFGVCHQDRDGGGRRRVVTLVGAPHEVVTEAQGEDDLGGRR